MEEIIRECGDCTLCCELLPIGEINKPASVLCGDCVLSEGCGIYESRPKACKDFNCSYLTSEDMVKELKPNICNVIFETVTDTIHLGLVNPKHLDAWRSDEVQDYVKELNKKGISVIISSFTREPKRVSPTDGITAEEVMRLAGEEMNKIK